MKSKHPIKEYKGFWWVPDDPRNQYFGILEIDESGEIYLHLYGNSRNDREEYLNIDYSIMYGVCKNDVNITVFNKFRSKGSSAEFYSSSIEYRHCLIGYHLDIKNEIGFKEIQVNLSELFGWFVQFEVELILQKKNRHYIKKELYHDAIRKVSFCAMNGETSSSKTRKIEMQRQGYLKIEYTKPQRYYDIFEELKLLSMLMSILGREAIVIQDIQVPYMKMKIPRTAKWFVNNQTYFRPNIERSFTPKHSQNVISNSFNDILRWIYNLDENNKFILEVISDRYLRPSGNSRIDFFNIVSAYESWHRSNISEMDSDNIKVYNQIIELVKGNKIIKDWIGSRSILFKGMSLPKRIEYLIEQDKWNLIRDKKKFKNIVSNTRNMIAHNLKQSKSAANFIELIVSRNIIHSILEIQFLKTINLPKEFIDSQIQNHPMIQQVNFQLEANRSKIRF